MLTPDIVLRLTAADEFMRCARAIARVPGWLNDMEGYTLMTLAGHDRGPGGQPVQGCVAEIGSFKGRSTCWLAAGVQGRGAGKVYAIDHFTGSPEHQPGGSHADPDIVKDGTTLNAFRANIARLNLGDHVEAVVAPSLEAAKTWSKGPIRLLFIDGDHSYEATKADLAAWKPHLAPGALVAFHDVGAWEGVTRFYTELMASGPGVDGRGERAEPASRPPADLTPSPPTPRSPPRARQSARPRRVARRRSPPRAPEPARRYRRRGPTSTFTPLASIPSSRRFRTFALKAKSNTSPSTGISPTSRSSATFPSIRASTPLDAPSRCASYTMYSDAAVETRSPTTGTSPMIGSTPKLTPSPGTSMALSISTASRRRRSSLRARSASSAGNGRRRAPWGAPSSATP